MTQMTTIDTDNFAAMAKAMGMGNEGGSSKQKSSTLARLRLNHKPIMGEAEVNGKKVNMEVVSGGTYKLDIPDVGVFYADKINLRVHLQRFMYKKFVNGSNGSPNRYVKTVMADNLNVDLKDNDGGFNCGKPAGYIKDWSALDKKTQDLIKQIKRVRVILGTVELVNPTDAQGNSVELDITPFIWEIENKEAFKDVGALLTDMAKMKRLPVTHNIETTSAERPLPNGDKYYVPVVTADMTNVLPTTETEHKLFGDFMAWVQNYNEYIINAWQEKAMSSQDEEIDDVDGIVDIDFDEEVEVA